MQTMRIRDIQVGQVFDTALFLDNGQKLLGAGVEITERHLDAMRRGGAIHVILANSLEEMLEAGMVRRVEGQRLTVGQRTTQHLMSPNGQIVVEAGEQIEAHHLDAIHVAGGAYSSERRKDPKRQQESHRRERLLMAEMLLDELIQQSRTLNPRVHADKQSEWFKSCDSRDWPAPSQLTQRRESHVEQLRQLYARIEAGVSVTLEGFEQIISQLLERLTQCSQRFTQLALLCPRRADYLPDHAYTVTVLAMAIAAHMNWSRKDVRQLALTGLLFDLGMLLVPERIRTGANELTDLDRGKVNMHPVLSLSMMQVLETVPGMIRLAAVQHHERENGTGYPRGLRGDEICDYARVLAVADTFAAATSPRHYRHTKLPYVAMEETVRMASSALLWTPAVRALVKAAGLFPVGSYVRMSNGRIAHVLACNPATIDRPLIQIVDLHGQREGEPINLAKINKNELAIVRPQTDPTRWR